MDKRNKIAYVLYKTTTIKYAPDRIRVLYSPWIIVAN